MVVTMSAICLLKWWSKPDVFHQMPLMQSDSKFIGSMYGIFTYIYHKFYLNVG